MKAINQFVFRIFAILMGCVIAFVIAEVGIRLLMPQMTGPILVTFDSELGPIPVPNQQGRRTIPGIYSYTFSNNSLGLRSDKEYSFQKQSDFRILLLGDSFCYGYGVDDNQTFAYGTQKRLSSKKRSTEAINAGNGGQGTDYALKFFQTLGHKFTPDLTVLCFFSNDFEDNERSLYFSVGKNGGLYPKSLSNSLEGKKEFLKHVLLYNCLISWSHVANLFKQAALKILVKLGRATENRAFGLIIHYGNGNSVSGYSNEQNIELTSTFIRHLRIEIQKAGSDFLVLYIPSNVEIELYRKARELSRDENALRKILESQHIELLSLTATISNTKEPIPMLYYREEHWTPLAHSLVAGYLSEYIKKRFESAFSN
jgi:hypothetical protein